MKRVIRFIAIVLVIFSSLNLIDYGKETVENNVERMEMRNKVFVPAKKVSTKENKKKDTKVV